MTPSPEQTDLDALAEAQWAKTEATGMAYEFTPKTLVMGTFRDAYIAGLVAGHKAATSFHEDRGITLLQEKWLDPACHKGCQSLAHRRFEDELADGLAECFQQLHDQQAMPDDSGDAYYQGLLAEYADRKAKREAGSANIT